MDLRKIRKLIEIFNASNLSEIEIQEGEDSIRLTRASYSVPPSGVQPSAPSTEKAPALGDIVIEEDADESAIDGFTILAPMVGTFFTSSSPDDEAFVKVGDEVSQGQPLCLIEAMKIFNQIEAERDGIVVKILKENGDPVEYGEPLFLMSE